MNLRLCLLMKTHMTGKSDIEQTNPTTGLVSLFNQPLLIYAVCI